MAAALLLYKPGDVVTAPLFHRTAVLPHRCLSSCRAVGRSTVVECLQVALKIVAVWILNVLVQRPTTSEKQKQWANTAAW